MSNSTTTDTRSRALTLLGQGLGPEIVASAIGVTTSTISQLLSTPEFQEEVAHLRFRNLSRHNERDSKYDQIEEALQERLESLLPMMYKPFEVLRAIQVINQAKRRGSSAPEAITQQQTVIPLVMPTVIMNNYTHQQIEVNVNNQVVKAGEQELVTVQSHRMEALLKNKISGPVSGPIIPLSAQKELQNVSQPNSG